MTDRELLELAAKAAGVLLTWSTDERRPPRDAYTHQSWNPLADDGDALRLAVKIGLSEDFVTIVIDTEAQDGPYLAVRRAIVNRAAQIGKAMK